MNNNKTNLIIAGMAMMTIVVVVATTLFSSAMPTWACGRCWNVTAGENLSAVFIDRTGDDAGYAIEAMCTTLNKPDPPGSTLNLTCEENNQGTNLRYVDTTVN